MEVPDKHNLQECIPAEYEEFVSAGGTWEGYVSAIDKMRSVEPGIDKMDESRAGELLTEMFSGLSRSDKIRLKREEAEHITYRALFVPTGVSLEALKAMNPNGYFDEDFLGHYTPEALTGGKKGEVRVILMPERDNMWGVNNKRRRLRWGRLMGGSLLEGTIADGLMYREVMMLAGQDSRFMTKEMVEKFAKGICGKNDFYDTGFLIHQNTLLPIGDFFPALALGVDGRSDARKEYIYSYGERCPTGKVFSATPVDAH
jgi:hypothetical protein